MSNKPIFNKLLRINSIERLSDSKSSSDFVISYPNVQVLSKVVSVVLKHCSFPNVFYNIKETNNVFQYEKLSGGGIQTIIVPVGNYTLQALIAILIIPNVTITQNQQTLKLNFLTTGDQLKIYHSATSTLAKNLGIPETTVFSASITADNVPSLQGVTHVFIASKVLSKGSNFIDANKRQELPIFSMIPNTAPYGGINHYESPNHELNIVNFESETDLQIIDIKLYDGKGDVLSFHGAEVNLILKIYYRV